ncbi:2,' 3'-cyclic nucleotide 2'-phosphodiesterase [Paenibacillus ottowii]|uniref:2,' 3'-cyclic nucleotide 2'-phosphodiesterase n=1 Tax=Paenibacillus ottowii TaxID=2315729 RepID=UPI0027304917|nr:2,' 3'-cyclic nucleotide 2'-phosphodiesterase [Paenibacillus ottowii]MDP1513066.1 2,' 3'-cyclic nucleotide 2'-phosphodiesterase [Paenibacillus ottowii]
MKKWSYLLSGILIGIVVATAGSSFADQVKSLIGEKVAGEYAVKVNGNSLVENAIVVDGKAHVPLRAVTDSLGASLKVEGKTVEITAGNTTEIPKSTNSSDIAPTQLNEKSKSEKLIIYSESDKSFWERSLSDVEDSQVKLKKRIDELSNLPASNDPITQESRKKSLVHTQGLIEENNKKIDEYKAKIAEIEENLAKYKNYRK